MTENRGALLTRWHWYSPTAMRVLVLLALMVAVLFVLIEAGVIEYAYGRLGVSHRYLLPVLLLSLGGAYVNIPVYRLRSGQAVLEPRLVWFLGTPYVVPETYEPEQTVIAINVGGAVLPTVVSLMLIPQLPLERCLLAVGIVTLLVHAIARPVEGVGIVVPAIIPPVAAAAVGWFLLPELAPKAAYVAGTLGSLIGADLLNLPRIGSLRAPVASIGGAGTFDGIFLTGIAAVLLA